MDEWMEDDDDETGVKRGRRDGRDQERAARYGVLVQGTGSSISLESFRATVLVPMATSLSWGDSDPRSAPQPLSYVVCNWRDPPLLYHTLPDSTTVRSAGTSTIALT